MANKSRKLKIGVVGVGHLGRLHVKQLKQIAEAEIVGIYDVEASREAEVSREFEVPAVRSFDELLERSQAISIVTPTTTHFDYARRCLQAKLPVFVEKPFTETVGQAEKLVRLARSRRVKMQVGHIERFNPAIVALESVEINPLFIESHRLANFNPRGTDVDVVLDLMIHDIDLILSFVKSPLKEAYASGIPVISRSEDIANCRLRFENGCVANVTASRISSRNMRKMRFFQPRTYISVDFLEGMAEIYSLPESAGPADRIIEPNFETTLSPGSAGISLQYSRLQKADINPLRYELRLFCRAVLEDTVPPITAEDGLRALRVAKVILGRIDSHTELVKKHWKF